MEDELEETEVQDALADLSIIDAIIAADPQPKKIIRLQLTTMGHINRQVLAFLLVNNGVSKSTK